MIEINVLILTILLLQENPIESETKRAKSVLLIHLHSNEMFSGPEINGSHRNAFRAGSCLFVCLSLNRGRPVAYTYG